MPIKLSAQANSYRAFHQGIAQTQVGSKYTEGPRELKEDGTQQPRTADGGETDDRRPTEASRREHLRPNRHLADHSQKTLRLEGGFALKVPICPSCTCPSPLSPSAHTSGFSPCCTLACTLSSTDTVPSLASSSTPTLLFSPASFQ